MATIKYIGAAPEVRVAPLAYAKMQEIIAQCDMEVGWLGEVEKHGDIWLVTDIHLFQQEVNATTCEIDEEDLSNFGTELLKEPDGVPRWNRLALWGHSHVDMGVSPSGQDNSQMEEFAKSPWFLRVIGNKKGAFRYDLYDFARGILFEDIEWALDVELPIVGDVIGEELKAKVKKKVYTTTTKWTPKTTPTHAAFNNVYDDAGYDHDDPNWSFINGRWVYDPVETEKYAVRQLPAAKEEDEEDDCDWTSMTDFMEQLDKVAGVDELWEVLNEVVDELWYDPLVLHDADDLWAFYDSPDLCACKTTDDVRAYIGDKFIAEYEAKALLVLGKYSWVRGGAE